MLLISKDTDWIISLVFYILIAIQFTYHNAFLDYRLFVWNDYKAVRSYRWLTELLIIKVIIHLIWNIDYQFTLSSFIRLL